MGERRSRTVSGGTTRGPLWSSGYPILADLDPYIVLDFGGVASNIDVDRAIQAELTKQDFG